jgi:CRISP-associated protein Cas1
MKHLCIVEYGTFIGLTDERLTISHKGKCIREIPFSRLKTVLIAKNGVSFSSDVVIQCAQRGIRLFLLDFRGVPCACLSGVHQHAVVAVRRNQFTYSVSDDAILTASEIIRGKIKNQRATIKYFGKYILKSGDDLNYGEIEKCAEMLSAFCKRLPLKKNQKKWRNTLMGIEGKAADGYWAALAKTGLLPQSFKGREHRGAKDIVNSSLNYGYSILASRIWTCLINAGLEPYLGVIHTERPGKPSLVLDLMEEYRSWVVDRTIIKLRNFFENKSVFDQAAKKRVVNDVLSVFQKKHKYGNKKLTLDSIIQRQTYRLAGVFSGDRKYKPFLFNW